MFDKIDFGYPSPKILDHAKEAAKSLKKESKPLSSKDIEPIYNRVNDYIHLMTDHGDGTLEFLDEVRDELYALLR